MQLSKFSIGVSGQILKNNIGIWSHWLTSFVLLSLSLTFVPTFFSLFHPFRPGYRYRNSKPSLSRWKLFSKQYSDNRIRISFSKTLVWGSQPFATMIQTWEPCTSGYGRRLMCQRSWVKLFFEGYFSFLLRKTT